MRQVESFGSSWDPHNDPDDLGQQFTTVRDRARSSAAKLVKEMPPP